MAHAVAVAAREPFQIGLFEIPTSDGIGRSCLCDHFPTRAPNSHNRGHG